MGRACCKNFSSSGIRHQANTYGEGDLIVSNQSKTFFLVFHRVKIANCAEGGNGSKTSMNNRYDRLQSSLRKIGQSLFCPLFLYDIVSTLTSGSFVSDC